jgi:serine phosphatase RsbU (regulator of sigma subunit)
MTLRCVFLAFLLLLSLGISYAQKSKADSLMGVWNSKTQNDTTRIQALVKMGKIFVFSAPDSAEHLGRLALKESERIKDFRLQAHAFNVIGVSHVVRGDYSAAEAAFTTGLERALISKDKTVMSFMYGNLGSICRNQSNFLRSIELQKKSLELKLELNDKRGVGLSYVNIGNLYKEMNDFEKVEEYYSKAIALFEELKDEDGLSLALSNLSSVYSMKEDYKGAIQLLHRSLFYRSRINDVNGLGTDYASFGECFRLMGNLDSSFYYYRKAEEVIKNVKNKENLFLVNHGLYMNYWITGNLNEALRYAKLCVEGGEQTGLISNQAKAATAMYNCFRKMGKKADALDWYEKAVNLEDSVSTVQNKKEVLKKQYAFDYAIQRRTDSIKAVEEKYLSDVKHEQEIKTQRIYIYAAISGFALMILISFLILRGLQQKKRSNRLLEEQNVLLQEQKVLIEEKQKEILDSMQYAKQNQRTLLANHDMANKVIPDSFVVFRPKDIVSGDFYWATKKDDRFYFAVCDSTGHGVPGAFMSLLNISFLNEAIIEKGLKEPNEVFDFVRKKLIDNISQEGRQDGMDGILICIDSKENSISYTAAHNAPLLISGQSILELKADKMPVGKGENMRPFSLQTFEKNKGDMLYLFTDGFADQFGGPKGKKFRYKQLEELLMRVCTSSTEEQKSIVDKTFEDWKGSMEQVDDVCVIGIRL